jgi:hypothetical protein
MARTIPDKDTDFNVMQDVIFVAANTHYVAWGLDNMWMDTKLLPAQAQWVAAWAAYQDPNVRTPLHTFGKNAARKKYEKLLRLLVRNIKASTRISDEERRAMGIAIPLSGKLTPKPTTCLDVDIDTSILRCLTVHFRDQGSERRAKPKGIHGCEIRWAILNAPPVSIDNLLHTALATRSPYMLEFSESQRGQVVWFCLRWENTRGEKGPWSEIVSAIIS